MPSPFPPPPVAIGTLKQRADFLAANKGLRVAMPGFVLLARQARAESEPARIGFTVTRKIGGAVVRNRMKRRFRALARTILPQYAQAGHDYVLIGRAGGIERSYDALSLELAGALERLAAGKADRARRPRNSRGSRNKAQQR